MKESRKILKLKARQALSGRYSTAVGALFLLIVGYLIFAVMAELCAAFFIILAGIRGDEKVQMVTAAVAVGLCFLVFYLFFTLLIPGICRMYLNICQNRQARVWDLFWAFTNHGGKFFGIGVILILILACLTAPLIVLTAAGIITGKWEFALVFLPGYEILLTAAGLYVNLTYGQFYLILADDPEKSVMEALEESRLLMKGSRLRFFALGLSFLVWVPIIYITGGIACLWLIPYMTCTGVCFYLNLKEIRCGNQE